MAVDVAAHVLHGVVEVHAPKVSEADRAVEVGEGLLARLVGRKVITRGEGVAGVYTYAYARLVLHEVYDARQMGEVISEIGALAGGVLDDGRDAVRLLEGDVYRLGDAAQALLLRDGLQVAARVEVEAVEPQSLAPLHLVQERGARLGEPLVRRVSEVDQIAVVGQYLLRRVSVLGTSLLETFDLRVGEGRGGPLTLVLGEECESRGSDVVCVARGVLHTARGADVCAYVFHDGSNFTSANVTNIVKNSNFVPIMRPARKGRYGK